MLFPIYIHVYVKHKKKQLDLNKTSKDWVQLKSNVLSNADTARTEENHV